MKKKIGIIGIIVIIAFCFFACDTGPKEFQKNFPAGLRGTWERTESGETMTIVIEKDNFTSTLAYGANSSTEKGKLAYGIGPISGPDGDFYILNIFFTSYTTTPAETSTNFTTNLNILGGPWEVTVKKDEMKMTYYDDSGSSPQIKAISLKKK